MFKKAIVAIKNGEPIPRSNDGEIGFGPLKKKPFKSPFKAKETTGSRKRTRVDYSKMGGGDGDGDGDADLEGGASDEENRQPKKKAKKGQKAISFEGMKGVDANGASLVKPQTKYEYFKAKDGKIQIARPFSIPSIMGKNGERMHLQLSNVVLGTRQTIEIPPRPLHDPMGEHAIVLFDPTTDDVEAEREKARLQKEQEEMEVVMASQEGGGAVVVKEEKPVDRGPHKSLAAMLGIKDKREAAKIEPKVAVVIDPDLSKVLRPHQVEGVKVSLSVMRNVESECRDAACTNLDVFLPFSFCIVVPLA
jgi:DNA repair and recombination RAD54-like protein